MRPSRVARAPVVLALVLAGLGACHEDTDPARASGPSDAAVLRTPDDNVPAADPLEVSLAEGNVRGTSVGETRQFLGIPYAEPPVGALRFAPPQPVAPWTGVKDATAHGPSCVQNAGTLAAPGPQSEDCLTVDVYAPVSARKLPVMVWIHGGAFVSGGSVQYDGTRLAGEGSVIVVTLNYRLGALGFLAHAGLDATRAGAPSGNDAIRDQLLALRWVRRNIAAFGGDPDNVTLLGESAGAACVCVHMVSPESQGLVARFVLESGVCTGGFPLSPKTKADALGAELAAALCSEAADGLACLRDKPAAEIAAWGADRGLTGAGWNPVVNAQDPVLPQPPLALLQAGAQSPGELLLGTNKYEWALFLFLRSQRVDSLAALDAQLKAEFGAASDLVEAHYAPTEQTANDTFVAVMTDAAFRCPARKLARLVGAKGSKVYLYSFEEGVAFHGTEIPYVFGNPSAVLGPTLVEPLRANMQAYWRSFAVDGDPNVDAALTWPPYEASSDQHMVLKASSEVGAGLASADCDFWDQLDNAGQLPDAQL